MPVICPIHIESLDQAHFGKLDYSIMPFFYASQKVMGHLADEAVYQADVAERLMAAGFTVDREVPVTATFRTFCKIYKLDMVVNRQSVYELKTVKQLTAEHKAQVMNYLMLRNLQHGKLVNLRTGRAESAYVNAGRPLGQRQQFKVSNQAWAGGETVHDWVVEMLRDWGTGLELPLYHQCLVHLLGGEHVVTKQLPMRRGGIPMGCQRFHLVTEDSAFRLTAFAEIPEKYPEQLNKLIRHSPVKDMHWINIALDEVTFQTVTC